MNGFNELCLRIFGIGLSCLAIAACDDPGSSNNPGDGASSEVDASAQQETTPIDTAVPDTTPPEPEVVENTGPSCDSSSECPYWYCECEEGPPVNSAHCTNGRCEDAPTGCPYSCAAFDTCWTGTAGGGWEGGSNAGPSTCE